MNYVWESRLDLKGSKLLVALAIADHANDEGQSWPSIPSVAQKVRLKPRQVFKIINELENDLFSISRRPGVKQTKNKSVFQMLKQPVHSSAQVNTADLCTPGHRPVRSSASNTILINHQEPSVVAPQLFVKTKRGKNTELTDEQFLELLRSTFDWVDIESEMKKAAAWCIRKNRRMTRAFFQDSWLSNFKRDTSQKELVVAANGNGNGHAVDNIDSRIKAAWNDLAAYQRASWTFTTFAAEFKRIGASPEQPDVDDF